MTYEELDAYLASDKTRTDHNTEDILQHFLAMHECIPINGELMFMCSHGREFKGQSHLVAFHQRNSGKVPLHIYHYIVMTYCISGKLKMRIGKENILLSEGDFMIMDRHVPHSVEETGEHDLGINIILNSQFMNRRYHHSLPQDKMTHQFMMELINQQKKHEHYLIVHTHKDQLVESCIRNILCEELDPQPGSGEIVDSLISILLTQAARLKEKNSTVHVKSHKNEDLMNDMLTYIKTNYASGNLQEMCEHFGYEASTASRMIKNYTGSTFKALVNEQRMIRAAQLLKNTDMTVYEVAQEVGISNLTAFYKRFQEYMEMTPQSFRARHQPDDPARTDPA